MSDGSNAGQAADFRAQVPAGGYHCPTCKRGIYSRRLKRCGFCGAPIPITLQFTPQQIQALDRELDELEEQRRRRQIIADEEARAAAG
jgi:hypothetical protein